jgi:hypothetical protein
VSIATVKVSLAPGAIVAESGSASRNPGGNCTAPSRNSPAPVFATRNVRLGAAPPTVAAANSIGGALRPSAMPSAARPSRSIATATLGSCSTGVGVGGGVTTGGGLGTGGGAGRATTAPRTAKS